MEEKVFISDEHTDEQAPIADPVFQSTDYSDCIPGTTTISQQCDPVPCETTIPRDKPHFWERLEAPLLPLRSRPKCNFIHPQQLSPFPERLELPFSSDAMLSGYEDIVSSGSDLFTLWVKVSPHEVLAEHVVDIHKVLADFRDAFERKQSSSSQTYGVNKYFSSQSPVQRRLSIYKWNPGPRRGREDAFEKNCGEVAYHYLAGSFRMCRTRNFSRKISRSYRSVPRDPLCGLRDSLQQGHLLSQHRCQVHLPS